MKARKVLRHQGLAAGLSLLVGVSCMAQKAKAADAAPTTYAVPAYQAPAGSAFEAFFAEWQRTAEIAKETQPHWITPVATVTPRLEQEIRYDMFFQQLGNGAHVVNYDGGKGLELIPTTTNEVIINAPPYVERTRVKPVSGFNDWPVFLIKQRFLSANEEHGNYILTGFLSLQVPTGVSALTNNSYIITPTIAGGKGWGDFDIQATIGVPVPTDRESIIGTSIVTNIAFQYHFAKYFWPEFELNDTYWFDGQRGGKNQLFLTPGIIFGRFPIGPKQNLIVGVAYQFAVSPKLSKEPVLTPMYDRAALLTARLTF